MAYEARRCWCFDICEWLENAMPGEECTAADTPAGRGHRVGEPGLINNGKKRTSVRFFHCLQLSGPGDARLGAPRWTTFSDGAFVSLRHFAGFNPIASVY